MRIAVIGTGPAGLAAATELRRLSPESYIVVFDKGREPQQRQCPIDFGKDCNGCRGICNVISGFGGCLQNGDAIKLSRYPSGRRLRTLLGDNYDSFENDAIRMFGVDEAEFKSPECNWRDMNVRSYPVAEMSKTRLARVINAKHRLLTSQCDMRMVSRVRDIVRRPGHFLINSESARGRKSECFDAVLIAVGRAGVADVSGWLSENHISIVPGNISIGVRFELPAKLLRPLYDMHRDFKFTHHQVGHKVKSFCFSASTSGGAIKYCHYGDQFGSPVVFLDAHIDPDYKADASNHRGNFALLAQVHAPGSGYEWLKSMFIPRYVQTAGGYPIWQNLSEVLSGKATNSELRPSLHQISKGTLSGVLGEAVLRDILSSYLLFSRKAAAVLGIDEEEYIRNATVMGPAVEFAWDTVDVDSSFETSERNLFVVGDCAGVAQGIIQASISGIAAARELGQRERQVAPTRLGMHGRKLRGFVGC